MHYKKFFSATALVTLLSLSNSAFSDPMGPEEEDTSYYVRGQYNLHFKPPIDKLKTTITGIVTTDSADTPVLTPTVDPYNNSLINGSVALGYKLDDIRVELEGSYTGLSKSTASTVKFKVNAVNDKGADIEDMYAVSAMVNAYYDLSISDEMPITPYVGVGVGAAYASNPLVTTKEQKDAFAKRVAFAYQAKIGVSYAVTPEINLYAGARYFGTSAAKFGMEAIDDDKITVGYGVVGAEAGVMFNF